MASPNKRGERKDPAFLFYATTWLQSAETNSMTLEQFQKFDSKVMDKLGHQEVGFEVAQAL